MTIQDRLLTVYKAGKLLEAKLLQKNDPQAMEPDMAMSEAPATETEKAEEDMGYKEATHHLAKMGINPDLCKVAPPEFPHEAMMKLKAKYGEQGAFRVAWAAHSKNKNAKKK